MHTHGIDPAIRTRSVGAGVVFRPAQSSTALRSDGGIADTAGTAPAKNDS